MNAENGEETPGEKATNEETGKRRRPSLLVLLPLVVFAAMVALFFYQLESGKDPSILPSALIHKQAPAFELAALPGATYDGKPAPGLARADFDGKVTLLNFWASWCVPCRQEHPILLELAKDSRFQLVGINVRDSEDAALGYLTEHHNPFSRIGYDKRYRVGIDFGVTGQPETFLIDKFGCIRYKHIGPLYPKLLNETLLPLVDTALAETTPVTGCEPPAAGTPTAGLAAPASAGS